MDFKVFFNEIEEKLKKIDIQIGKDKAKKLYDYMNLMLEWNKKINLTAIIEPEEIILKHFIDSLTILKYLGKENKIIDVGTGAGFPGIPLNILDEQNNYILLDSLNKRINFLNEVIEKNELINIKTIHSRVEEAGKDKNYREKFDIAVSRAVAPLNILLEYMLPLVRVGGICICMKGSNIDEIENSKNALNILGGKIEKIENIYLPDSDIARNIIIIKKIKNTPNKYPRKAGTPSKEPII